MEIVFCFGFFFPPRLFKLASLPSVRLKLSAHHCLLPAWFVILKIVFIYVFSKPVTLMSSFFFFNLEFLSKEKKNIQMI